MTTSALPRNTSGQLLFEEKPMGLVAAIICFVIVLLFLFFAFLCIPPQTGKATFGAILFPLLALFFIWAGVKHFNNRGSLQRFLTDRIEIYQFGKLSHTLLYNDVTAVSYGFRAVDEEQFLDIEGPPPFKTIHLTLSGNSNGKLTRLILDELRTILMDTITKRLLLNAQSPQGALFFKDLRFNTAGVIYKGVTIPWSRVELRTDDATGFLDVRADGQSLGTSVLILPNMIPAFQAAEYLKSGQR